MKNRKRWWNGEIEIEIDRGRGRKKWSIYWHYICRHDVGWYFAPRREGFSLSLFCSQGRRNGAIMIGWAASAQAQNPNHLQKSGRGRPNNRWYEEANKTPSSGQLLIQHKQIRRCGGIDYQKFKIENGIGTWVFYFIKKKCVVKLVRFLRRCKTASR